MDFLSQLPNLLFMLGPRSKVKYKVEVDDKIITISAEGEESKAIKIYYEDIIGTKLDVECLTKAKSSNDATANNQGPKIMHFLTIYSYPSVKNMFGSKCSRKRLCTMLGLTCLDSAERNKHALTLLKEIIDQRLLPQNVTPGCGGPELQRFDKPLLILLNPASGKGQAKKLFKDKISPMLQEASCEYTIIETERQGHGTEIARTAELSEYSGIVIVSGDGLLFEVYQGLMSRSDSAQAVKIPIGVLPAGSGNALCCSVNYSSGEPFLYDMMIHSTFVLLKHCVRPMDIVAIDTATKRLYSFLSVTWGMVADIDIESERFRKLGNARFTVEALYRIMSPRTYRGKLSFLPSTPYVYRGRSKSNVDVIDKQPQSQHSIKARSVSTPPAHNVRGLDPPAQGANNSEDLVKPTNDDSVRVTQMQIPEEPEILASGEQEEETATDGLKCDNKPIENGNDIQQAGDNDKVETVGIKSDTASINHNGTSDMTPDSTDDVQLPPLSEPVPANWVTIEDNFVAIVAAYQSHLGPGMMAAPAATMIDGLIYLLILRAPISRMQMFNFMGQLENGGHVKNELVELVAVRAFRLEPQATEGNLVVDGEKVDYGPIQGKVLPAMARIVTK